MREFLNLTYHLLTESMDEIDKTNFDRTIAAAPGEKPRLKSKGVETLLGLMGQQGRPR